LLPSGCHPSWRHANLGEPCKFDDSTADRFFTEVATEDVPMKAFLLVINP
jgi:hypothetical protein